MAQVYIRDKDAATYFGVESSYATTPSMTRAFPIAGSVEIALEQTELDVEDESVHLYDYKSPEKGLKGGGAKLGYYLRPGTQLVSGATVANPVLGIPLVTILGGQSPADAATIGTTVASAASATSITVTSATGFALGQWILVGVSDVLYPTRIVQITTSTTFTLNPALPGTPAGSQIVAGMYNYYPTPANTATMTLQHALVGDDGGSAGTHHWTLNGCTGEVQFKTDRNALLRADFDLKAASWTGPSDQNLTVSAATDSMGVPWSMRDATCLLQATSTTTRTHYPLASFAVKLTSGMAHVPELGGTEGTVSVMRSGQRLFAEATIRVAGSDTARDATDWVSRTALQCVLMVPQGSGTTKRFAVFDMPTCVIVGKPKVVMDGGRVLTELTLRSKLGTLCTGTASDLTRAPFIYASG